MMRTVTAVDNRKVSDLSDAKQSVVWVYLKRMSLTATEFEMLWQGYVVDLPDKIKARIGVPLYASRMMTMAMWA